LILIFKITLGVLNIPTPAFSTMNSSIAIPYGVEKFMVEKSGAKSEMYI
jgi:hypothetical protein